MSAARDTAKRWRDALLMRSLRAAARAQGLVALRDDLTRAVPDISDQYSEFAVDTPYLALKVRGEHAFQMSLVRRAIAGLAAPVVVDIGDSAGTHLRYMEALFPEAKGMRCLSVNLDAAAVERIRAKGLEAVCARAEDLAAEGVTADVFLLFETLEHITDPVRFLHALAGGAAGARLVLTVPYVTRSRVGLHDLRRESPRECSAENTHVFELSPDDWQLLVRFAGWRVDHAQVYRQYPGLGLTRLTRSWWRRYDFEGFFGMVLTPDDTWSRQYGDW